MRTPFFPSVFLLLGALSLTGCASKPADSTVAANDSAQSAAPLLTPLLSAAKSHPAPGSVSASAPNLDRSETAAAQHPENADAQRTAAFCYYRLQAYAQAAPAFEKVIILQPTNAEARRYLGYSQMANGTLDDAIATFLTVTEMKGATPADVSDAYLQVGNCDWALKHDDEATEAFHRSVATDPKQGRAWLGLGTFAAEKGKSNDAREDFNHAVATLPGGKERAQAYACLGRLAEESKDATAARTNYQQALTLDPKNAWAKQAMGRLSGAKKS